MSAVSSVRRIRAVLLKPRAVEPREWAAFWPDVVDIELRIAGQLMVDLLERLAQGARVIRLAGGVASLGPDFDDVDHSVPSPVGLLVSRQASLPRGKSWVKTR